MWKSTFFNEYFHYDNKIFFLFSFFSYKFEKEKLLKKWGKSPNFQNHQIEKKIKLNLKNDEDVKYKLVKTLEVHCVFKYKVGLKPIGIKL